MSQERADEGLGLIEIVVAMFLIAALSLALLPILINGLKQSALNATISTASQVVRQELETASSNSTCKDLTDYRDQVSADDAITEVTDPRGVVVRAVRTVGACPASAAGYPGTVSVMIEVKRMDTGKVIATGSTLVYVQKAL